LIYWKKKNKYEKQSVSHGHENTKPYKRTVECQEESTRNPNNVFQEWFLSLIVNDAKL